MMNVAKVSAAAKGATFSTDTRIPGGIRSSSPPAKAVSQAIIAVNANPRSMKSQ